MGDGGAGCGLSGDRLSHLANYEEAASMYRACRTNGETVRKLIDCLIASVAVRAAAEILHADADFIALERHTSLSLHTDSLH